MNKTGKYMFNVTLRRVHISLLPWKSNKYYIFVCVCVCALAWLCACAQARVCMLMRECSLAFQACNSYAPCCDVLCGPSGYTIISDIIS